MNSLRSLVEAGPHEAPEYVEASLKCAFRRHHRARRLRRTVVAVLAVGAAAACVVVVVRTPATVSRPAPVAVHAVPPDFALVKSQPEVRLVPVHKPTRMPSPTRPSMDRLAMKEFVPLPFGDDSLVSEGATVVRVELPRSALRLAGFNVAQERANDRIEADVVVGPDGLAHAVRFLDY